ncbi:MAG: DUF1186 domain-containing protein [bacterium]
MIEINDILGELSQNRGYFPVEAVRAAIEMRDEITPRLLQAIKDASLHVGEPRDDGAYFLPLYSMYLLAQFREQSAYPLIIELCRLPRETLDDLLGDTITEGLSRLIASVCDGNVTPIKSIVEDASVDEYVRGSALRSLAVLVYTGMIPRSDVIAYFAELFHGKLEKEYSHIWDVLASEAVDLYAKTLAEDIHASYESGLLSPGYMQPREVNEAFAMTEEAALSRSRQHCRGLISDVVNEMNWWHCFKPKRELRLRTDPSHPRERTPNSDTVVRSEPKVGRNAPCPCGSGKKFKKCCETGRGNQEAVPPI